MSAAAKPSVETRHLPYDVEVEQSLLGLAIVSAKVVNRAIEARLEARHFYDPMHARIWDFLALSSTSPDFRPSPLTVHAALKNDPGLAEVGGHKYLSAIAGGAPGLPVSSIPDLCRILIDLAMRRELVRLGEDIVDTAYRGPADLPPKRQIETAERRLDEISGLWRSHGGSRAQLLGAGAIVSEAAREAEAAHAAGRPPGLSTGLGKLNDIIGGWHPTDFVLVPGRPGMAKSALLTNFYRSAIMGGTPAIFFSHEMSAPQLGQRIGTDQDLQDLPRGGTPLSYSWFRNGRAGPREIERLAQAGIDLAHAPGVVIDDDTLGVAEMAARTRAFCARHEGRAGLIFCDYAQIVPPPPHRGDKTREWEVSQNARAMKAIAKSTGWTFIAAAQINRQNENRAEKDRRPRLADLRESGQLEAEADIVLFPYRPGYYVEERKPASRYDAGWSTWLAEWQATRNEFELIVAKNRHGPKTTLGLWCDMRAGSIRDECPAALAATVEQENDWLF